MQHYSFIWSIIAVLQFGCCGMVVAQRYTKGRILTVENGLSDNRVNCFYKDKAGFIWIGTRNGLNRYDGHAFSVFRPAAGNAISNEIINSITGDAKGNIWVATMNGLNRYDPVNNNWECILPPPVTAPKGLPNSLVWEIQYSKEGLLWIASDVFEFCSYDPERRRFTHYNWPGFAKTLPAITSSHYMSVQKFVAKSSHEFWLGTTRGLVLLDTRTGKFKLLGSGYNGTVSGMLYDSVNRKIFVSLDKGKCFVYDENKLTWSKINAKPAPYPSDVFTGFLQSQWLPAHTGMLTIPADNAGIQLSVHIPGFSGSLPAGAINTFYTDDAGTRWVGTDNGVAIYDPVTADTFLPLIALPEKSPGNTMGAVYFDTASDSYFVCSLQPAMVFIIPAKGGPIKKIVTDAEGNPFSSCNSISADNEGNIWLMTDRNIYRYNRKQVSFTKFPAPNRGDDGGFRTFVQDEQGNYWFGTFLQSIFYYNRNDKKFETKAYPFLPWTKKIGSLSLDTFRHCVWISAYGSDIIKYDLRSGKMEGFEDRPGLSALNLVNDILTDSRGNTWMATSGSGIIQFPAGKPAGTIFKQYDMKSGLPENSYTSMCEDASGNIWLLSERGFTAIDSSGKLLAEKSSLPAFGFSAYTSDSRSPHRIFFNKRSDEMIAAAGGGLYFRSLADDTSYYPFKLIITGVHTNMHDSAVAKNNFSTPHRLPFRNNYLRIDFAGLYYGPPEKVIYEYMLSGYDRQWNASNHFTAVYQNLPPGKYQFQLRATYTDGYFAAQLSGFEFDIIPPFWKTDWFIIAMILLICIALAWLVYSLLQKIRAEKIVNAFATSLYGQHTIEDICQDITRNCVTKLGFVDGAIYLYDESRQLLIQKAAYSASNTRKEQINNGLVIPLGKGVVGWVAMKGKMKRIGDVPAGIRYEGNDGKWNSEIAIPFNIDGKLFGVLDSVHTHKHFYSRFHEWVLKKIAALCAERIARYQAEEKLRDKIARDLHDEMGSTLTSINIMCKVAMEENAPELKVNDYLQKIKDNSGRMLESIGDMVWVINPANDNFEQLLLRMKEFTAEVLEPMRIDYRFREEGNLHTIQLNAGQRKEMYMIFKEALTNAVKYSGTSEILIGFTESNGMLAMLIEDKGCGFDENNINAGNGLRNIKARAAAIGAEIRIESEEQGGTSIHLQLQLTPSGYKHKEI